MNIQHWIIGPQLVAFIMFFAGYIQQVYPPNDINGLYGYRTRASKQNQQTFSEGNRYSANLMMKLGLAVFIVSLFIIPFIDKKHQVINSILTPAIAIVIPLIVIALTEKHLKKVFDHNNNEIL